jgi:hypothetical protein
MWAGGMTDEVIRFNEPSLDGNDVASMQNALERGHTAWSRPDASLTFTSTPLALAREGAQLPTGLIAGMSLARPR